MVWLGIKKLGRQLNLQKSTSEALGIVKNSFVKMADRMGMKTLEIIFPESDEEDKENIIKILKNNKIKEYNFIENGISIIYRESFAPYSIKKIKILVDFITDYFYKKYPKVIHKCHKCHATTEANIYYSNNGSIYLCDNCLKEIENKIYEERLNYTMVPSNYLFGFIGALFFSIPGIIITTLFFIFLKSIAACSGLLYVVLGKIGYQKFKGKMTPIGAIIISLVGIIMTVIGIIISYSLMIFRIVKSIDIVFEALNMPEIQREIIANIVLALVLSSIFIIITLFQMIKDWSFPKFKKVKNI